MKKFIATAYYFEGGGKDGHQAKSSVQQVSMPFPPPTPVGETGDQKFHRLMSESAKSLESSNELVGN